jgi:transcriptional regulator with XRE-family HTH domain
MLPVVRSAEHRMATQLGRALARERAGSGFTQEQVAEQLGLNVETISRFERGAVLPTLPRLFELADMYDVPVSRLLRRSSSRAADLAEELVDALDRLNEADRVWVGQWLTDLCERLCHKPAAAHASKTRDR